MRFTVRSVLRFTVRPDVHRTDVHLLRSCRLAMRTYILFMRSHVFVCQLRSSVRFPMRCPCLLLRSNLLRSHLLLLQLCSSGFLQLCCPCRLLCAHLLLLLQLWSSGLLQLCSSGILQRSGLLELCPSIFSSRSLRMQLRCPSNVCLCRAGDQLQQLLPVRVILCTSSYAWLLRRLRWLLSVMACPPVPFLTLNATTSPGLIPTLLVHPTPAISVAPSDFTSPKMMDPLMERNGLGFEPFLV